MARGACLLGLGWGWGPNKYKKLEGQTCTEQVAFGINPPQPVASGCIPTDLTSLLTAPLKAAPSWTATHGLRSKNRGEQLCLREATCFSLVFRWFEKEG